MKVAALAREENAWILSYVKVCHRMVFLTGHTKIWLSVRLVVEGLSREPAFYIAVYH